MNPHALQELIADLAEAFAVPGVAAGVWHAGKVSFACHGVTSIENPLPVDEHTLFQAGSIGKTLTAMAVVRLAESGHVELNAPVRRYVPELRLADSAVTAQVTLLQLLNHTAGWEGDFFPDTGEGDDALACFVARMDALEQLTPPGTAFSYNNAAFCLAGRVIEHVTGDTYETAIRRLILQLLGLRGSFFFPNEVMTRRFAVGHKPTADGSLQVARPWALPRNGAAAGGLATCIGDLLAWARFHLGDGRGADGTRVLSVAGLEAMREPTVRMPGSAFGDALGIGWFLGDIGGVRRVGHDGSTNGQEASLWLLPEHDWALALLTNASPGGLGLNPVVRQRVLAACTGIVEETAQPVSAACEVLTLYEGLYGGRGMRCRVTLGEAGDLVFTLHNDPEMLAQMFEQDDVPSSHPTTLQVKLVSGQADRYVFVDGPLPGVTVYFVRDGHGRAQALHLFGRRLPLREP
ncbi:beta-lactamase family protein [Ectothiorhodospira haloalkaliphila]|uniref:serine hydrolase domain-containing protein n=1 Tax=Ectothiorhodospira haloalkaliphila TaxID=421628 RepID=UPI001EE98ECC|nr:serine hydrolase domain-containing protein [Ectothiorhodospira haloalkaliphila]MCG5525891.1 beta-lactamase family protein [Ectothiorhodospira haloalkaliphila]